MAARARCSCKLVEAASYSCRRGCTGASMSQSDGRRKRAIRRASLAGLNDDAQYSEIAVFFLDESDLALTVANSARVRHVCVRIAAMLGLVDDMDYALFTLRERDGLFCLLNEEVSIASVRSQCRGGAASAGGYAWRIFYRRWFWHPRSLTVLEELSTTSRSPSVGAHLLAFADARTNFVAGNIEVPRLEMALLLAALLLTCDLRHRGSEDTRPKRGKVRIASSGESIPVTSRAFRAFLAARLDIYLPGRIISDSGARSAAKSGGSGGVGGAFRRGLHSLVDGPKQKKRAALVKGISERYLNLFVHAGMASFEAQSRFLAVTRALTGYGAFFQRGVVSVKLRVVAGGAAGGGGGGGGAVAGSAPPPKGPRPGTVAAEDGDVGERSSPSDGDRRSETASLLNGRVGSSVGIGCKGLYLSLSACSTAASSRGGSLGARIRRKSQVHLAEAAAAAAPSGANAPQPRVRRRSLAELLQRKAREPSAADAPPVDGSGAADATRTSGNNASDGAGAGVDAGAPTPRLKRRSSLTKIGDALAGAVAGAVAGGVAGGEAEKTYFFPFSAADTVVDPSKTNAHILTLTMHPSELPATAALEISISGLATDVNTAGDVSGGAARRGRGAAVHQLARMLHKIRDAAIAIEGGGEGGGGGGGGIVVRQRRLRSLNATDWDATEQHSTQPLRTFPPNVATVYQRRESRDDARVAEHERRASLDGSRSPTLGDSDVGSRSGVEQRSNPGAAGSSTWWYVFD